MSGYMEYNATAPVGAGMPLFQLKTSMDIKTKIMAFQGFKCLSGMVR